MTEMVLVLNADLGPLHRVSLRHAVRMLCRGVAEVHEAEPDRIIGVYPLPRVVRLINYVVTRWRFSNGPTWTRVGVLRRDEHRCQYCGVEGANTVDHVVPRSLGGKSTWRNTVAACNACNQRKRDRTPVQSGMRLLAEPRNPTWAFVRHKTG